MLLFLITDNQNCLIDLFSNVVNFVPSIVKIFLSCSKFEMATAIIAISEAILGVLYEVTNNFLC